MVACIPGAAANQPVPEETGRGYAVIRRLVQVVSAHMLCRVYAATSPLPPDYGLPGMERVMAMQVTRRPHLVDCLAAWRS
jgi:hypothetical protein